MCCAVLGNPSDSSILTNHMTATAIASGVIACMLQAGQAKYTDNATMKDKPVWERVRQRLDEWAVRDGKGLKHLKNAAGLTLVTPPGYPVSTREPELHKLTIDDQILGLRDELTWKQNCPEVKHEECEKLRKELGRLNKLKASGLNADIFVPLTPLRTQQQ